jgi:hypothetical protein
MKTERQRNMRKQFTSLRVCGSFSSINNPMALLFFAVLLAFTLLGIGCGKEG